MSDLDVVGGIVRGKHGHLMIRQKSDAVIELGDLLVVDDDEGYTILQVFDLGYGSQVSTRSLEMISGMQVEGYAADMGFMDPNLRNYVIAEVKSLAKVEGGRVRIPKTLPKFLNRVRHISSADLSFLDKPSTPLYVGNVRSGSKILDVPVHLDAERVFTHHVLCPATTGRGKSNLIKTMVWSILDNHKVGLLILDSHDEYFGRHGVGFKDHPKAYDEVVYYSPKAYPGSVEPVFNLKSLRFSHFRGIIEFSQAQVEALQSAYSRYRERWIERVMTEEELDYVQPITLQVLKRRLSATLGIYLDENGEVRCRAGTFSSSLGETTLSNIIRNLEDGRKVIMDTSLFSDQVELLIGSMILNELLNRYKRHKQEGLLETKPLVNVVIEEAPRVLGGEAMSVGSNIYSDIAREGRKFKIGLTAITQLTSVIPRPILANMNTKIILGNELMHEREAIINTAAQDLSQDDQNIASLDVGEAIISSNFTRFAVPVKVPLFEDHVKDSTHGKKLKIGFVGGI